MACNILCVGLILITQGVVVVIMICKNQDCVILISTPVSCSQYPDLNHVARWLDAADLPSFYCSRETLEVVRILGKVMDHWLSVVSQVCYQQSKSATVC